jgi:exosortase
MRERVAAALIVTAALLFVYLPVLSSLVRQWSSDENYSHGFFVVPLAAYFVWERRGALRALPIRPAAAGLAIVGASLLVLTAGRLAAELFLTRVSLLGVLAGGVVFLLGWRHLRLLTLPIAFLLLMIPLPAVVFNQIAMPLQLLASRAGEAALGLANVPVLREGNILVLPHTALEVAEACSGIRSLISLLTLGIVLGYFAEPRGWARFVLAVATVPIAIVANGARVAGTGIAAAWIGQEAAEGFFHTFSGWLVFVVAFVLLMALQRGLARVHPTLPRLRARTVEAS